MNYNAKSIAAYFLACCIAILSWAFCPLYSFNHQGALLKDSLGIAEAVSLPQGPVDSKEVESFVDEFINKYVPNELPGAVFVLVKEGKILFSKGYGYANLEQKIPMDPDKTIFRVGSLSKLVTSTAVMHLVEQGKIEVNEDVSKYLGSNLRSDKGFKPVTLDHLLTHTDGFDVAWIIGGGNRCESKLPTLEQLLSNKLPPRVFQPGQFFMYGDAGISIAGRLIEVVAGVPFDEYISQKLFKPLGMVNSSFQQFLPSDIAKNLAVGYRYNKGGFAQAEPLCMKSAPSNAMVSSAKDMAHFMILHLNRGSFNGINVLNPRTIAEMQRRHFGHFPKHYGLPGTAYGFYERHANNQYILEHGGSMYGYISQILLLPEQKTGFFFAYNTNHLEESVREELIASFLNHYYPEDEVEPSSGDSQREPSFQRPSSEFQQLSRQITGRYRYLRYPRHSIAKVGMTLMNPRPGHRVVANPDGTVTVYPGASTWKEVEPLVFQYADSKEYITFKQDDAGRIVAFALSGFVFWVFERVSWYESGPFQICFIITISFIFISGIMAWVLMEIRRSVGQIYLRTLTCLAIRLSGLIGALYLIFMVMFVIAVSKIHYWKFVLGMPLLIQVLLYLPILSVGLTVVLSSIFALSWKDKYWSSYSKNHVLLFLVSAWLTLPLLTYWNLLGFRFL